MSETHGVMRTWGRVLRLSLAATAVADVLAGSSLALFGEGTPPLQAGDAAGVGALVLASLCVYHGGMALNDWADRERDARERPDRPLPTGAVSARAVLAVALGLLVLGPLCAAWVAPRAGAWMAGVALCAALYDLVGRGPWRGPALLAACRAGNLATPLVAFGVAGGAAWRWAAAPLAYGAYVFVVSRLGRLEDAEDELVGDARPRRLVAGLVLLLAGVAALPLPTATVAGRLGALALALPAAYGLGRAAAALSGWTRADVERTMGCALRRLLVFSGALAVLPGSPASFALALVILAGYPLALALRRAFPPS